MIGSSLKNYLFFGLAVVAVGLLAQCGFADSVLPGAIVPNPSNGGSPAPANGADPMYTFTYSDPTYGISAYGVLDGTIGAPGQVNVTGVSLTVTAPPIAPTIYALYSTGGPPPTPPAIATSPDGAFIYDDVLYPTGGAGGSDLDADGLLFRDPSSGIEINIWGNGGTNNYTFYQFTPNVGYTIATGATGTFTLTAVPLPATAGVGFGMLGVFGCGAILRKRLCGRNRIA